jgi:phosphatidylglycerophosphate synthase
LSAGLFAVIAGSDFLDGQLARALRSASDAGRLLDHASDICFVVASLSLYWWLGIIPWWVPASVVGAFVVYVGDSWRQREASAWVRLIGSRIGHIGGVLNYALIGILVGNETLGIRLLPRGLLEAVFWLVPLYSGAAIASRLMPREALRHHPRAPSRP